MYTISQIANEINNIKPDFTEFKQILSRIDVLALSTDIDNTSNIFSKLFKCQLILSMSRSHSRSYIDTRKYAQLLFENVSDCNITLQTRSYNNSTYLHTPNSYRVIDSFSSDQIASYIKDVQKYLPKFLWDKVRTKATQEFKTVQPDLFSLHVFKNYLAGLKKEIPSTQAIKYLGQIAMFELDIKQQYIEVIANHLSQPSLAFQDKLSTIIPKIVETHKCKFMYLDRYHIKWLTREHKLIAPESVMDSSDSSYKPFITGIKRKPTIDLHDFTALIGTLIILRAVVKKQPNEVYSYFIEEITEHLKHPDYSDVKKDYMTTLQQTKDSIEETINGFI